LGVRLGICHKALVNMIEAGISPLQESFGSIGE